MRYALALLLAGCATAELPSQSTIREVTTTSTTSTSTPSSTCEPFAWPVRAQVSSGFGLRDEHPHTGIDLPVPEGTRVGAACDGLVTYAGERRGYGRLVVIDHGDGRTTLYAHNLELLVRVGDRVTRGDAIARAGQTGRASGPHVHFELREHDRPIDPLPHLEHLESALRLVSR